MKKYFSILSIAITVFFSGCTYDTSNSEYISKNSVETRVKTYEAIVIPIDKLYINTCSKTMLISINGIGEKKANRIIEARNFEPIRSMEDIEKIKGLGTKTILEIEKRVIFDGISNRADGRTNSNNS